MFEYIMRKSCNVTKSGFFAGKLKKKHGLRSLRLLKAQQNEMKIHYAKFKTMSVILATASVDFKYFSALKIQG